MSIIVQKYGGTSVCDTDRIMRVAEKIVARKRRGDDIAVVVSAMADTTDDLISLAKKINPNPPKREYDMLLTAGERISMALLSMAIQKLGEKSVSFTGSQSGIITDDDHTRARIIEVKPTRIIETLNSGKIAIVAGFQGVSAKKDITTLGRGGSDTSAVALAIALGAEVCEIYTDVDGVFSADPKIVENPYLIKEITYSEMLDLSFFGAKVLHPRCVELARSAKIPLKVLSSLKEMEGTTIMEKPHGLEKPRFVGIASRNDLALCFSRLSSFDGVAGLFSALDCGKIRAISPKIERTDGSFTVNFILENEDIPAISEIVGEKDIQIKNNLCAIAMAGEEIACRTEIIREVLIFLESKAIEPVMIDATKTSLTIFVDRDDTDDIVKALHERFIEGK